MGKLKSPVKMMELNTYCPECNKEFGIPYKHKQQVLKPYKDATWEFVLQHAKTNEHGTRCSFGITHQQDFEGRVYARMKGYKRDWVKPMYEEDKKIIHEKKLEKVQKNNQHFLRLLANKSLLLKIIFKIKKLI